ncbi:organomercurial lyase [Yinghuangia seranimata]|uniref:organomercurial lyase n=1 Tax=Yinghuangia seranimata TaxID=408067 RepID=UPI00248C2735|nr:organomercurial lyase [Yinghuangia seranimata]MDI2127907.1 organomercurial lyase [Yinghuangia seranimata]
MNPHTAADADDSTDDALEDLRLAVYRGFASTGRAPGAAELAAGLGLSDDDVRGGLRALSARRHLALGADGSVVMAHPFSSVPLGFSVMGPDTLWWGGCAWDAFAIPHLLPALPDVLVATRCPGCGAPLAWVVNRDAPPPGTHVAHFLVPAAHMWDDVVHTCGNQRLFCRPRCVDGWLKATGRPRGYVMDLPTLWRLARGWYAGRLDRGYRRREPAEAAEYFRAAGLEGPFWGL